MLKGKLACIKNKSVKNVSQNKINPNEVFVCVFWGVIFLYHDFPRHDLRCCKSLSLARMRRLLFLSL